MTSPNISPAKPLTVSELIEHLRTLPRDKIVFRAIFDDGYSYYPLMKEDVRATTLEESDGRDIECVVIGDLP
jgi:hypothetical protein